MEPVALEIVMVFLYLRFSTTKVIITIVLIILILLILIISATIIINLSYRDLQDLSWAVVPSPALSTLDVICPKISWQ